MNISFYFLYTHVLTLPISTTCRYSFKSSLIKNICEIQSVKKSSRLWPPKPLEGPRYLLLLDNIFLENFPMNAPETN